MQLQHFIVVYFFFSMKLPYDLYPVSTLKRTNRLWFSFTWGKSLQRLILFRLIQSTKYIHFLCHLRFTSNSLFLWIWIMANTSPGFFLVEQIIRVPAPRPSLGNSSSLMRWIHRHTHTIHTHTHISKSAHLFPHQSQVIWFSLSFPSFCPLANGR